MKVQKYKCWPSDEQPNEENTFTYTTSSPEAAAEFLCEEYKDCWTGDDVQVDVEAEDGTVYGVTVEVQRPVQFHAQRAVKN